MELSPILKVNDEEFRNYIPVMFEISYILMFKLYERHRDPKAVDAKNNSTMPYHKIENYCPTL